MCLNIVLNRRVTFVMTYEKLSILSLKKVIYTPDIHLTSNIARNIVVGRVVKQMSRECSLTNQWSRL